MNSSGKVCCVVGCKNTSRNTKGYILLKAFINVDMSCIARNIRKLWHPVSHWLDVYDARRYWDGHAQNQIQSENIVEYYSRRIQRPYVNNGRLKGWPFLTYISTRRSMWSRQWLLKRQHFSHTTLLRELRDEPNDWRNYLRMDIDTYTYLLELVTPHIIKENTCMRTAISPHERLTATLRFLATGRSYKDLEFTTIISKQSLSEIIPETRKAIFKVLKNEYLKVCSNNACGSIPNGNFQSTKWNNYTEMGDFPKTEEQWLEVATEFERMWQFPHCLGSIDGKHIRIVPPKGSGVVLMAIANANCEFLYCDIGTNGRISDGGVINNTNFYEKLVNNELRIPKPRCVGSSNRVLGYVFVEGLPQTYTPPESMDRENLSECTVQLGDRCDSELLHDLQRGTRGQILNSAIVVRDQFKEYFNNEGSVPWQDKFIN
ncbi:hypothetical protein NQ318_023217 [Aromia moschata]|uniref:DDE Tnp4 domain-containing protein n=1 Tax=Aromia moschata TaxID=1265417 RepID=A0AAV8XN29_9CUCU|nr:hypothetical protein NQ318_023217 [Aromia moschata]